MNSTLFSSDPENDQVLALVKVKLGAHFRKQRDEHVYETTIEKVIVHPGNDVWQNHDIALLRLTEEVA